jgi:adenine/guanine phosphoribosyltransferase-like PRPP-binding protein
LVSDRQPALAAKSLIAQSGARSVGASIVVDQLVDATRQALAPCHMLIRADELG